MSQQRHPVTTLTTPDEHRQAIAIHEAIHGDPAPVWEEFLFHHPHWAATGAHRAINVDGSIVALTSLAMWQQRFGATTLPAGEIGLVGTLPGQRNRGYSRALMESWMQTMRENRIPLSFLIGIPGFYERWGYHYAAPDHVNAFLSITNDPLAWCAATSNIVRDADPDRDPAAIASLVAEESRQILCSPVLKETLIRYFIERADADGVAWRVVEDSSGELTAVVRMKRWEAGIGPQAPGAVTLVAARNDEARGVVASILLEHLRQGKQAELPICIAPHGPFARWLYQRGAKRKSDRSIYPAGYAAMYRINDLIAVLTVLRPLWPGVELERRFAGVSVTLRAGGDDDQVVTIAVTSDGVEIRPGDGGVELGAPPAVVIPWIIGWRAAADWIDGTPFPPLPGPAFELGEPSRLPPEVRELLRTLFPARHPYIGDTIQSA